MNMAGERPRSNTQWNKGAAVHGERHTPQGAEGAKYAVGDALYAEMEQRALPQVGAPSKAASDDGYHMPDTAAANTDLYLVPSAEQAGMYVPLSDAGVHTASTFLVQTVCRAYSPRVLTCDQHVASGVGTTPVPRQRSRPCPPVWAWATTTTWPRTT